jgi:hypothetical protein
MIIHADHVTPDTVIYAAHVRTADLARAREARAILAKTPKGHSPDLIVCSDPVMIRSAANNLYVSAELGYTGASYAMLRARAAAVGPWEQWYVCRDEANENTFMQSDATDLVVSAELGYTGANYGMLRARASDVGPWETFYTPSDPGSPGPTTTYFYSAANDSYVSAELGYTGASYAMLRARATAFGPWETFSWVCDC